MSLILGSVQSEVLHSPSLSEYERDGNDVGFNVQKVEPTDRDALLYDDVLFSVFRILWKEDPEEEGMTVKSISRSLCAQNPSIGSVSSKLSNLLSAKLNSYIKKLERREPYLKYVIARRWSEYSPRRMLYVYKGVLNTDTNKITEIDYRPKTPPVSRQNMGFAVNTISSIPYNTSNDVLGVISHSIIIPTGNPVDDTTPVMSSSTNSMQSKISTSFNKSGKVDSSIPLSPPSPSISEDDNSSTRSSVYSRPWSTIRDVHQQLAEELHTAAVRESPIIPTTSSRESLAREQAVAIKQLQVLRQQRTLNPEIQPLECISSSDLDSLLE